MNVLFSFVEMFVNKVLIYNMSLVRCLWTWQLSCQSCILEEGV